MFSGIVNAVGNAIKGVNVLPAIIGGGASLIGGMMTNQAQANQAAAAQSFSADQAEKQMDFQERMRETQYQTTVKDLIAAGLNPMLAYSQGGAGTPSGSAAVGQQATLKNPAEGLAASAAALGNIEADLELKTANTNESYMRADNISADTKLKLLQAPNVSQTLKNLISEQLLNEARLTATNAEEAVKRNIASIQRLGDIPEAKSKGKYFTEWPNAYQAKEQSQIANSAASAAANIVRGTSNMFRPNTGKPSMPTPSRR
jgi:hypothetical protein